MNGRKTTHLPRTLLLITLFFLALPDPLRAENYYVKPDGTGTACSRQLPCHFTTALAKPGSGHHIFFRHGPYTRVASSVLRIEKELYLYGGWDGSFFGDLVINPELYESILDGENDRPVIQILGARTIVTGFTIQNGDARNSLVVCKGEGSVDTKGCGGGIYAYEAEALIVGNKILNNQANAGIGLGGGVHLEKASGTMVLNNLFQGNQAVSGGGLFIYGSASSPPQIKDNRFIRNSAETAGGIAFDFQANPTIQENHFDNNSATHVASLYGAGPATIARNLFQNHIGFQLIILAGFQGNFEANRLFNNDTVAGLYLLNGSPPYPNVVNNIIAKTGSECAICSGGNSTYPLTARLEHNTLVGEDLGKAIMVSNYSNLTLNNNIISGFPTGIDNQGSPSFVMARHTLFDNSVTTPGNNVNFVNSLVGDPAFKDPAANDFHISLNSAARDAGISAIVTSEDIDGDPRPIGRAPDIGADEINPSFLYLPLIKK